MPASPAFTLAEAKVRHYWSLVAHGKGDGNEAELLRADVADLYGAMSEAEGVRLQALSDELGRACGAT